MKVLVHDPMEYPDSSTGALVQPGENVILAVSVTAIESDDSVRQLKVTQRGCLFADEVSKIIVLVGKDLSPVQTLALVDRIGAVH